MIKSLKGFISVAVLIYSSSCLAQNVLYIDSLYHAIREAEDMQLVKIYTELAWEYRKGQPDSTIFYCEKVIVLSKKFGENKELAKIYNFLGLAHHYKGNDALAFEYYFDAQNHAKEHNDSIQFAHSQNNLGKLYTNQGEFVKAYGYYFEALNYFKSSNNISGEAYTHKGISDMYEMEGKYHKALESSQKAIDIWDSTNEIRNLIGATLEHARIYEQLGNAERAIHYYVKSQEYANTIGDNISIARIYVGLSVLYFREGQYQKAIDACDQAEKALEGSNNENLRMKLHIARGKSLFKLTRFKRAIVAFNMALKTEENSSESFFEKEAYYYLSEVYKEFGDFEKAYLNHVSYSQLRDNLNNLEIARQVAQIDSKMELEKKEKENEILRLKEAENKTLLRQKQFQNYALIVVIVIIALMVYNIWSASRKMKKANKELALSNQRISAQQEEISAQNLDINDKNLRLEKRNSELADLSHEKDTLMNIVAHDLKSPLNQIKGLTSILLHTEIDKEQKSLITKLNDIADNGTKLIKDVLDVNAYETESRQLSFVDVDLMKLLEDQVNLHNYAAEEKSIDLVLKNEALHLNIKSDAGYINRIIDNILSNAIKFSNENSSILVSSGKENGFVYFSIKDNGPGFSEEDRTNMYKKFTKLSARPTGGEGSNGLGLAIIKTLTDQLGGTIELNTELGIGSEFTVKLPY